MTLLRLSMVNVTARADMMGNVYIVGSPSQPSEGQKSIVQVPVEFTPTMHERGDGRAVCVANRLARLTGRYAQQLAGRSLTDR